MRRKARILVVDDDPQILDMLKCTLEDEGYNVDLSITAQLKALREYAFRNGYTIVREFVDEAESGRTTARPAFREMISLAKLKYPPLRSSWFGNCPGLHEVERTLLFINPY